MRVPIAAWFVIVTIAVVPAAAGRGQQPAPGFKAGIDLITFEATALDADGRPVRNLGPDDFVVTIGGRPRKVVFADFHNDGVVVTAGGTAAAPVRDSRSAVLGAEGRIVVIVVDRDSLEPGNEAALLETATTIIDGLQPADAVGLMGVPVGGVELTRDHDRVRKSLHLMSGTRPRQTMYRDRNISWDEALAYERGDSRVIAEVVERECYRIPVDAGGLKNRCPPDLIEQARELLTTGRAHVQATTSNLEGLAARLAPLRGSKHIIFISGGLQFGQDLLFHFERFAKKAAEAQLTVYAVHLDQPDSNVTDRRTVTSAFGGREATAGLGALTGMTGGRMFMGVGRGTGVFERITTEINNFYVLGVESGPEDAPGSTRKLEVTAKRPGVTVRSRPEVAPRPSVAEALAGKPPVSPVSALLNQPTDISDLPVSVTAYSTRGTEESTLRVLISLELSAERARLPADWAFAVFNEGNVVATGEQRFEAGTVGQLVMTTSAKLLPGQYRLRAAARDAAGRSGVVDVPLAAGLRVAGELQMSDLIVGITEGERLQPRARVAQGTPLSAFIEVMSADVGRLAAARAVIEVIPAGTAEPVRRFLMAAQTGNAASVLINAAEIDTSGLPPGRYTASVVATVDGQPVGRVSRVFEVVPAP